MLTQQELAILPTKQSKRLQTDNPDRFQKALQHPKIIGYISDNKRFKIAHAGRRSFKTELAKRHLISEALQNDNCAYFFAAPTRDHAKKIAWEDLKIMSPSWYIDKVSDSELYIKYLNGSEIWVMGLDVPERVAGKFWKGCVLDEMGDMKENIWEDNIRPLLSDSGGWAWIIGVSRQTYNTNYRKLSEHAKLGTDLEWGDYTWTSEEFLSEEEIASIKSTTDELTYKREYLGEFIESSGRIYSYFDKSIHNKELPIRFDKEIFISSDFNISPCIWLIGQEVNRDFNFFDEVADNNTDVWKMCALTKERLIKLFGTEEKAKQHIVYWFGDYTGHSRTANSIWSSWQIIRDEFKGWAIHFREQSNPLIWTRVNNLNSRLRSADGKIHMAVSSRCKFLLNDMENVNNDILMRVKPEGDLGHASAAAGYAANSILEPSGITN